MHILHTVLYIFPKVLTGEFVYQSKALSSVIISFILMTLMCDSGVILWGEIRCWSLLGFKGLTRRKKGVPLVQHLVRGKPFNFIDCQSLLVCVQWNLLHLPE